MSFSNGATAPAVRAPWVVLLVCADVTRVAQVREALGTWPLPVTLRVVADAMPALQHCLATPARLVIVDWALDGPSGQALVRQLARLRPQLPVLAFDALGVEGPADQVLAWPWTELTAVLENWLLLASDDGPHASTTGPS